MKIYLISLVAFLSIFFLQCDTPSRLMNGVKAPNIELEDVEGNKVALESMQGKMVLIDFWASWCKPCLEAFPRLEEMYAKYKDAQIGEAKGLEIYSISMDENRKAWEKVLKRYQPSWGNQFIDTTAFTSSLIDLYQFEEIPAYYLIDERGVIIGINQTFAWMDYELRRRIK